MYIRSQNEHGSYNYDVELIGYIDSTKIDDFMKLSIRWWKNFKEKYFI